jgi:hypothetical protein
MPRQICDPDATEYLSGFAGVNPGKTFETPVTPSAALQGEG